MGIFLFSNMYRIIINPAQDKLQPSVVTIGNFDGVHLGHQQLFFALNEEARQKGYRRIAITFEPLPHEYFCDNKREQRLTRLSLLRDKFAILKWLGLIDELIVLHFNSLVATLTPEIFIEQILKKRLNTQHVVIGHDFKFGKGGSGSVSTFTQAGISSTVVPAYMHENQRVSSSMIREFAKDNDLIMVKNYLGRNLQYTSKIVHGNKVGRKFGVPTINLGLGRNRPALWGIYIAKVHINSVAYDAVASIGKNPTTNDLDVYKLEAHLLDVDLDLYGKIATVEILRFLRTERKFDDLDSLFKQIHQDLQDARDYFFKL